MPRFSMVLFLTAATAGSPSAAKPPVQPERAVSVRLGSVRIDADRLRGRLHEPDVYEVSMSGEQGRSVECQIPDEGVSIAAREATVRILLRRRDEQEAVESICLAHARAAWSPTKALAGKAAKYLGEGVRLEAKDLEIRSDGRGADLTYAATSAAGIRLAGKTFHVACRTIRFQPAERRAVLGGVHELRLELDRANPFSGLGVQTDHLRLKLDVGLERPFEVIFENTDGLRANLSGSRIRLERLTLRLGS